MPLASIGSQKLIVPPWLASICARLFGVALIIAAILKSTALMTSTSNFVLYLLNLCWIGFELSFGVKLAFGPLTRSVRCIAISLLAIFSLTSLITMVAGHSSCGCFGDLQVPPAYSLSINLGFMLVLINGVNSSSFQSYSEALVFPLRTLASSAAIFIIVITASTVSSRVDFEGIGTEADGLAAC